MQRFICQRLICVFFNWLFLTNFKSLGFTLAQSVLSMVFFLMWSGATLAQSDLIIRNLSVNPNSGPAGSITSATVSFTLYNQGSSVAFANTTKVRINTSTSNVTQSDYLFGFLSIPNIWAGSSYSVNGNISIPNDRPIGNNYIWVIADVDSDADQSDETNDYAYTLFTVRVDNPPTISITSPVASGGTYNTSNSTVNISGTAWDDNGVITVAWSNNRGGADFANGTTNWSSTVTGLQTGYNVITARAMDIAGHITTTSVTINYTIPTPYTLTINKTGTGSGTVSGGGNYTAGTQVSLSAYPDTGSTFAGWSPSPPCAGSFTMPAYNLTCTATFTANPVNGVCGSPDGGSFTTAPTNNLCNAGTPSSVTGTGPWYWSCSGSNGGTTAYCTANKLPTDVSLTVTIPNNGKVTSSPSGIDCGSSCSTNFPINTPVTLTATPDNGYAFGNWGGDCSGTTTPCSLTMTAAKQVSATFTANKLDQTITTPSFTPNTLLVGGTTTVNATASSGLTVSFSSTTPSVCSISSSTVTGVSVGTCTIAADQSGNANYNPAPQVTGNITVTQNQVYTLNVNSLGASEVPITANPAIYAGTTDYVKPGIAANTSFTLIAPATASGSNFSSWSGCDSVSSTNCTVTMSEDKTVTANYTSPTPIVTPSVVGSGGSVSPNTPQTVTNGATKSFTVTPNTGYNRSNIVGGTCPQGSWNGNIWTTGAITTNCIVSFSFIPVPDFVITGITINPTILNTNNNFNATVTVKNQGIATGDGKFLDVWTHQIPTPTCGSSGIRHLSVGTIAAGASKPLIFTMLSAGTAGSKMFRAFVDSSCTSAETNRTNNQATKLYTVNAPTSTVDFVINSLRLSNTAPAVNGTVNATIIVKNQGTTAGDGKFLDVWSNASTQACGAIGNQPKPVGNLPAGATKTLTFTAIPVGSSAGSKQFWAFVDNACGTAESNEGNNQRSELYAVNAPTSTTDFVVTSVRLSPTTPAANSMFTATVTVKNQGTATANGKFLDVWLNQPAGQVCGAVGNQRKAVDSLAAGALKTLNFTGLAAESAGAKQFRAFVDSACGTAESNEGNNQKTVAYTVTAATVDLIVTGISFTPATPAANDTFNATVTVKNQGNLAVASGGYLDVWTNLATTPSCGAASDGYVAVGAIAAGVTKNLPITGLSAGAAGTKTFRAFVDSFCEVVEANETNNQMTKAYTVQ